MSLSPDELSEFKTEAAELLELAEKSLLALEQGAELKAHFDAIFRTFHNLKGAAGMMELEALQSHMHQLENILMGFKGAPEIPRDYLDLFLRGVDATKGILDGVSVNFVYAVGGSPKPTPQAPKVVPEPTHSPAATATATAAPLVAIKATVILVTDRPSPIEAILTSITGLTVHKRSWAELKEAELAEVDAVILTPGGSTPPKWSELGQSGASVVFLGAPGAESAHLETCRAIPENASAELLREACLGAIRSGSLLRRLSEALHLLMYRYADLDELLGSKGQTEAREYLRLETKRLLDASPAIRSRLQKISGA